MATITLHELVVKRDYVISDVDLTSPLAHLKLQWQDIKGVPPGQCRLYFPADGQTELTDNSKTLAQLGIKNGAVIGTKLSMMGPKPGEEDEWKNWRAQYERKRAALREPEIADE